MRSKALAAALHAPEAAFELRSVPPLGDCFYDAMHLMLPVADRPSSLADAASMRDTVADLVDQDKYETFLMLAHAGCDEFAWLLQHRAPKTLDEYRKVAKRRGCESGAGQCLWADDFALNTISRLANVRLLIFDEEAHGRGGRSGRRRGASDGGQPDPRFVCTGEATSSRVCLLHRSRRQHYSPIFLNGRGVMAFDTLPPATRRLFPAAAAGQTDDHRGDGGKRARIK
jgi:hypothetical protein